MTELPEPMTPADCDLRDYPWMPVDVRRLLTSETWMDGPAEGKVAALSLWCEAWCQVPAGSLPDNERILEHLSQAGNAWKKIRPHAMRGWVKCSDGRLYHPVVCEKANASWTIKLAQRSRTEAARKAKLARKVSTPTEPSKPISTEPVTTSVTETVTQPVTTSVTEPVTGSNRTEQNKEEVRAEANASDATASADPPSARDMLWQQGVPILTRLVGKSPNQCRSLLGKLLRDVQDDCPKALLIIQQALEARPVDPVAWLAKAASPTVRDSTPRENAALRRIRETQEAMHRATYPELYADEGRVIDQQRDFLTIGTA